MQTIALTAENIENLNNLRSEAYEIMSDAAAARLVARIDIALRTGKLDAQTESTLALMTSYRS